METEIITECFSPSGIKVVVGSKWNYNRSLDNSQITKNLTVKEIQRDNDIYIVRFSEDMPYKGYGLGYFDGKIFSPVEANVSQNRYKDADELAEEMFPMNMIGGGISKSDRQLQQNAFKKGYKAASQKGNF